jgi:hypothetical protein
MEVDELNKILAAYDQKLEKQLRLNEAVIRDINFEKPKQDKQTIFITRVLEIIGFSLLALFLGSYIANNWHTSHLAISGILVGIFTLIALAGSIGQVVLLKNIDFTKPIVNIRKKIEQVNIHSLLFLKLMFLSAPIWWAFVVVAADYFFNLDLYAQMNSDFVLDYLMVNSLLAIPLVWFLSKLSYKNLEITWVKKTIGFFTSTKTMKALKSLKDIETFEN